MILEMALPENVMQEYKLLQKTQNISFTGFMVKMDDRYAEGQQMLASRKM